MASRILEKIASEKNNNFNSYMNASNKNMNYPIQTNMFDNLGSHEYGLRVKLGMFYEILTQGIYGGTMKTLQERNSVSSDDLILTEPDVSSKKYYHESKAIHRSRDLKLLDSQIVKYFNLEMQESGGRTTRFDIFRHDIKNLQSRYKTLPLEKLVSDLTKSTLFSLSVPFSIIFQMYNSDNSLVSRYDGDRYVKMTRIGSRGINELFFNPEETLDSFNIDVNDVNICKRMSPSGLKVNGTKIKPFPILTLKDKKYDLWKEDIKGKLESREGIIPQFYNAMNEFNHYIDESKKNPPIENGLFEEVENLTIEDAPF